MKNIIFETEFEAKIRMDFSSDKIICKKLFDSNKIQ